MNANCSKGENVEKERIFFSKWWFSISCKALVSNILSIKMDGFCYTIANHELTIVDMIDDK